MGLLLYGIPIGLGFAFGYIFTLPVNIALSVIAASVAGWLFWSTRNAELGSLVGVIAVVEVGIFLVSLWITIAVVTGFVMHIDLSWLLRSAAT